jgi:hypothetical protein
VKTAVCSLANLEELPDYERRLDRCDAARCNEKNMCVSFLPVFCCDESLSHDSEDVRQRISGPPLFFYVFLFLSGCWTSRSLKRSQFGR